MIDLKNHCNIRANNWCVLFAKIVYPISFYREYFLSNILNSQCDQLYIRKDHCCHLHHTIFILQFVLYKMKFSEFNITMLPIQNEIYWIMFSVGPALKTVKCKGIGPEAIYLILLSSTRNSLNIYHDMDIWKGFRRNDERFWFYAIRIHDGMWRGYQYSHGSMGGMSICLSLKYQNRWWCRYELFEVWCVIFWCKKICRLTSPQLYAIGQVALYSYTTEHCFESTDSLSICAWNCEICISKINQQH